MDVPKKGVYLNQFDGNKQWFVTEFDDGSAEIYSSWDEAYAAGCFQSARPELRLVKTGN